MEHQHAPSPVPHGSTRKHHRGHRRDRPRLPALTRDGEEISAVRKVGPNTTSNGHRGAWTCLSRIDGTGEPVTATTADTLAAAISADWSTRSMA